VIPAYNEAENIVTVVEHFREVCPHVDYIVVNDGSSDATATLCRKHGYPLLDLTSNLGLADAFGTGMQYAFLQDYDAAVQFDSDGQHKPEYLQTMFDTLNEGFDIVCGSRYMTGTKPWNARMIGSRFIAFAIRITTGKHLSDPTSGLRAYNRRVIEKFATQINMTPEPDTLSYLIRLGARITEVQVTMNERIIGKSYLTFLASIKYMLRICISILLLQSFRIGSLPKSSSGAGWQDSDQEKTREHLLEGRQHPWQFP
jgi:glycosyltransferase involved in cell wall biosynthesis